MTYAQLETTFEINMLLSKTIYNLQPTSPKFAYPTTLLSNQHIPEIYLSLPPSATKAHAYMNLKSTNLISIRQLCDSDWSALFIKKDVTFLNSDNTPVLNGKWNAPNGL